MIIIFNSNFPYKTWFHSFFRIIENAIGRQHLPFEELLPKKPSRRLLTVTGKLREEEHSAKGISDSILAQKLHLF
jgi:hypothetical protein